MVSTPYKSVSGVRYATVRYGDTVQAIAARELLDASQWPLIVQINGLSPPYLTGDPTQASASVLLYGSNILIPSASTDVPAANSDPETVYGTDVALINGSLAASNGDFALVSERANLKQALGIRISTNLGELLFHLDYGCGAHRIKGTGNSPAAAVLGAGYVKAALMADYRVSDVSKCIATASGDDIAIEASVQPIVGAPIDITG